MRIALFGGSFDPPHRGHEHVAQVAHQQLELDEVRLIPAYQPPHKPGGNLASDQHRWAMTQMLASQYDWLQADDRELQRKGTSFTIRTVEEILEEVGADSRLFFLLGSDSLVELPTWFRIEELTDLVTFITVPRSSRDLVRARETLSKSLGKEKTDRLLAHVLRTEPLPISSTKVRRRVAQGQSIQDLVPPSIADYIRKNELYASESDQPLL